MAGHLLDLKHFFLRWHTFSGIYFSDSWIPRQDRFFDLIQRLVAHRKTQDIQFQGRQRLCVLLGKVAQCLSFRRDT